MNGPGRYNDFDDEDWRAFGDGLFEWAISEYRQMLKARDSVDEAVCKLALNSALESLAKFFVVCYEEKGVTFSFDDAYKEAYDLVQMDTNLDLEQRMKL
jgi:hypothetical protein